MSLTSKEKSLRGRIGAHKLHATHDSREITQHARETFLARFVNEVDPDGILPAAEREKRAYHARQAYFNELALASARARRLRKQHKYDVTDEEIERVG